MKFSVQYVSLLMLLVCFYAAKLTGQVTPALLHDHYAPSVFIDGTWSVDPAQSAADADSDVVFSDAFMFTTDTSALSVFAEKIVDMPIGIPLQVGIDTAAGFVIVNTGRITFELTEDIGRVTRVTGHYLITDYMGIRRLTVFPDEKMSGSEFTNGLFFELIHSEENVSTIQLRLAMFKGEYTLRKSYGSRNFLGKPTRINNSDQLNYMHLLGHPFRVITNQYDATRTKRGPVAIGKMKGQEIQYFDESGNPTSSILMNRNLSGDNWITYQTRFGGGYTNLHEKFETGGSPDFGVDSLQYLRTDTSETIILYEGGQEISRDENTLHNGRVTSRLHIPDRLYGVSSSGNNIPSNFLYNEDGNLKLVKQTYGNGRGRNVLFYKYIAFDTIGNWTHRIVFKDRQMRQPSYVETRVVEYY